MLYVRALYPWFAILALAFVNGAFRELVLVPRLLGLFGLFIVGALSSCTALVVLAIAYLTVASLRIYLSQVGSWPSVAHGSCWRCY